jgi:hypothetical protein
MSEPGPPLIPREVLPAPVKPVKTRIGPRLPAAPGDALRQLSIFGAETTEPSPADLAGLLAGPGRLGRMGGTARVSVTVDAAWRVHALVTELVRRGLVVNWHEEDVRDDASPIVSERSGPSEQQVKKETSVRTPPVAATFDPDADPPPDLPSDVDFLPSDVEFPPDPESPTEPALSPVQPIVRPTEPTASPTEPTASPTEPAVSTAAPTVIVAEPTGSSPADFVGRSDGPAEPVEGLADHPAEEAAEDPELPESPPKPRFEVVTAYSSRLNPLARAWPAAAAQLFLSGPRLRLWVAAAGVPVPGGYALGLGAAKHTPEELRAIDAALVRSGLAGRLSEDGRHYVIAGRRRLRRLAELVGDRPAAAPPELWPDGAGA